MIVVLDLYGTIVRLLLRTLCLTLPPGNLDQTHRWRVWNSVVPCEIPRLATWSSWWVSNSGCETGESTNKLCLWTSCKQWDGSQWQSVAYLLTSYRWMLCHEKTSSHLFRIQSLDLAYVSLDPRSQRQLRPQAAANAGVSGWKMGTSNRDL